MSLWIVHACPPTIALSMSESVISTTSRPGGFASLYELTKPRITRLVTITSGVGFTLGAVTQHWEPGDLVFRAAACLIGTALSASGANALNQWWERDRDAVMPRTCARPIPTERVTPTAALGWGLIL